MKNKLINLLPTIKRILEMLLPEILLSVICTLICLFTSIGKTQNYVFLILFSAKIIFIVLQIIFLRSFYLDCLGDKNYFICNISACIVFAAIETIIRFAFNSHIYTYMFAVVKATHFLIDSIGWTISSIMFNFLMIILVLISPAGLHEIVIRERIAIQKEIEEINELSN